MGKQSEAQRKRKIEDQKVIDNMVYDENGFVKITRKNIEDAENRIEINNKEGVNTTKHKNFIKSYNAIKSSQHPTYEMFLDFVKKTNTKYSVRKMKSISVGYVAEYLNNNWIDFQKQIMRSDADVVDKINNFVTKKGQKNIKSLGSKICRHVFEQLCPMQNCPYMVYDSAVRNVLPYYLKKYCNIKTSESKLRKMIYKEYNEHCKCLCEKISEIDKINIDLYELDHLLWFVYREIANDKEKLKKVKNLLKEWKKKKG